MEATMKETTEETTPRCDICGSSQFMGSLCIPCHDDYSPHREPPDETAKEESDE